jgi:hypothetical protein
MAMRLEDFTLPHIEARLNQILAEALFTPFKKGQWVRYWGWKSDYIYVTFDTSDSFSFNCHVYAAPWPENDQIGIDRSFDIETIPWLLNKPRGKFEVPWWSSKIPAFRDEIVYAFESVTMEWFTHCDTPQRALGAHFASPHVNKVSPAAQHLVKYVRFLPKELENIACLVDVPAPLHDPYQRRLFIPPSRRGI